MKRLHPTVIALVFVMIVYLRVDLSLSEPRADVIQFKCGPVREHNPIVFAPNFVATMERISDQMRTNGFGTVTVGTGPDTNYGLAECYGDLSLLDCVLCYAEGRGRLPACYPKNSARVYLDGCFMRVENYTFYEEISGPYDQTICGNRTKKGVRFQESARTALLDAVREAPLKKGFARPAVTVAGSNESAYVLANCWKTVNESACRKCLDNASASIMKCLPWSEGRALNTGCFLRYSDTDFLNAEQRGGSKVSKRVILALALSSAAVAVIGIFIGLYIRKKRIIQMKRRGANEGLSMAKALNKSSLNFKYSTLLKATRYFDDANKLGQGGFGIVYKGVLGDGREIAVKRLFVNNRQRAGDFYNEVNLISSVEHKNLVRLLGCSISGAESLLVYEFLPNMSLDRFLFDPERGKTLNWFKRLKIITGTAEGLAYLHENKTVRIIHRDIKASNILLDSKLQPKIADFGLARTFQEDKSHISTVIAGTLGYMAPEYLAHGQLTEKADIYSFGVLVLEIVTGRQNSRVKNDDFSDSLIISTWKHFQNGTLEEIFDPNLMLESHNDSDDIRSDILRVVHLGLLCTQEIPALRPFISEVLRMLSKKDEELTAPTNPPFADEGTMEFNDMMGNSSQPFNSSYSPSVAEMSHSAFYPR
ncbi:Cell division control protein 2 [Ranunculus cassubicifolius]